MSLDFEKYSVNGNEFLCLLAEKLEVPLDSATRVIRVVFPRLTKPAQPGKIISVAGTVGYIV